jgi:hypothetical protein
LTGRKRVRGTHLWREIESQIAASGKVVLHQQWHFVGQADLDLVGEPGRLAEVDQVLKGEGEGDGFGEFDFDALHRLVDVLVAPQRNRAVSNVAIARELDAVFGGLDRDCERVRK